MYSAGQTWSGTEGSKTKFGPVLPPNLKHTKSGNQENDKEKCRWNIHTALNSVSFMTVWHRNNQSINQGFNTVNTTQTSHGDTCQRSVAL